MIERVRNMGFRRQPPAAGISSVLGNPRTGKVAARLLLLAFLVFLLPGSLFARVLVSGGGDALVNAVASASAGSVIEITDSATYEGSINWNKPLTVVASTGRTPTIRGSEGLSSSAIYFSRNASGSRLGSNDGGRIHVQMHETDHYALRLEQVGSVGDMEPVTIENVVLDGTSGVADSFGAALVYFSLWPVQPHDETKVRFKNVLFDRGDVRGVAVRQVGDRHSDLNLLFQGCLFTNFSWDMGFDLRAGYGVIDIENCHFDFAGAQAAPFVIANSGDDEEILGPERHWTLNVVESWVRTSGANGAIRVGHAGDGKAEYTRLNIVRSVLWDQSSLAGGNVLLGGNASHSSLNIIHSDLLRGGGSGISNVMIGEGAAQVAVTVEDSNLLGQRNLVNMGAQSSAEVSHSYLQGTTTGFTLGEGVIQGGLSPNYADAANGDFRYTNVHQTASSTGTPLGSNRDFRGMGANGWPTSGWVVWGTPGEAPGTDLPLMRGLHSTEALKNIAENRSRFAWAQTLYNSHYGPTVTQRYEGLSDEDLRGFLSELTPFRSVYCPDNPVRRWYNWRFEPPDRIVCLDGDGSEFYIYDPTDETEDWNPQGRLRFDRANHVIDNVVGLAASYHLNGNRRHGEQAAVILHRFAEVWPGWKIKHVNRRSFHDEPFLLAGRLGGWNIADGRALGWMAEVYELLRHTDLLSEGDKEFIEEYLFREAIDFFIHPGNQLGFQSGSIGNDEPAIYTGLAKIAVALEDDDLMEWVIDEVMEVFNPERGVFHGDGFWYEGAMNYHMMSVTLFLDFPQVIAGYGGLDPFSDPQFEGLLRALDAPMRFMWPDGSSPPINDGHRSPYSVGQVPPTYAELLFHGTGDPAHLAMAELLAAKAGFPRWQSAISLRFPPIEDSEVPDPPDTLPSELFPDMGYAHIRHGSRLDDQAVYTLIYTSMVPHGHYDNSAFTIFAHGHEMAMDIGYLFDEYTRGWATTTLGHNTVTVNRRQQRDVSPTRTGDLLFETLNEPIQAVETDSPFVYGETDVYRRLVAVMPINEDDSYMVDVFRVSGGDVHDWRLQSNGVGGISFSGVGEWASWPGSEDYRVTYFNRVLTDHPSPFQDAEIASPDPDGWQAEWTVSPGDEVRYRVHFLPAPGDQVVRASIPAARDYNRSDIDARMPGLMIHRQASESTFIALHEPARGDYHIESVERLDASSNCPDPVGILVVLSSGETHIILSATCDDGLSTVEVDGVEIEFSGRFSSLILDGDKSLLDAQLSPGGNLLMGGDSLSMNLPVESHLILEEEAGPPARWGIGREGAR